MRSRPPRRAPEPAGNGVLHSLFRDRRIGKARKKDREKVLDSRSRGVERRHDKADELLMRHFRASEQCAENEAEKIYPDKNKNYKQFVFEKISVQSDFSLNFRASSFRNCEVSSPSERLSLLRQPSLREDCPQQRLPCRFPCKSVPSSPSSASRRRQDVSSSG